MTDLEAIAARHARIQSDRGADSDWCGEDGRYWPCDTGQALDEMAALLGKLTSMTKQRDTLAAALMEAAELVCSDRCAGGGWPPDEMHDDSCLKRYALARSIVEPGAQ